MDVLQSLTHSPRDAQDPPGITGMGGVHKEERRTSPPKSFYHWSGSFGNSSVPSLMAAPHPTPPNPLLPGSLLTGFAGHWLEAGANPRVGAEWRSLSPDRSQWQGSGPRSGCCQLSHSERKYHTAGGRYIFLRVGLKPPPPPFTRREDSLCGPEEASWKEDPQGWDLMRSVQKGEGREERGMQE